MDKLLTIDEMARHTGLTAHTLRYYERIGLIAPVPRAPGGQRRYAASDLAWVEFLLRLRLTRMPIGQMLAFAQLRSEGPASVPARRQMLAQHLAGVQADIKAMQRAARALKAKIGHYTSLEDALATSVSPTSKRDTSHDKSNPPTRRRSRAG